MTPKLHQPHRFLQSQMFNAFADALFCNDRFGGFAVSLGGFGFSLYLTYLELFKIEAICQWCVASAVLMTILFLLNATRLIGYAGTTSAAVPEKG